MNRTRTQIALRIFKAIADSPSKLRAADLKRASSSSDEAVAKSLSTLTDAGLIAESTLLRRRLNTKNTWIKVLHGHNRSWATTDKGKTFMHGYTAIEADLEALL